MKTYIYYNSFMFTGQYCQERTDGEVRREVVTKVEAALRHTTLFATDISDHLRNNLYDKL